MTTDPALRTTDDAFWSEVREQFQAVADLGLEERTARLAECRDPRVRAEVASLLASHDEAGGFLGQSVWALMDAEERDRLTGSMIGPYRVVRPLGHGGMGSVFLASRADDQFSQRVAIKLVRGFGAGEALLQRFRQERQILAALEHPNIARLLDGGTTEDRSPYLVMEYVDGMPIDEYCRTHGSSTREKLGLFLELCDAVQYAHRNLIIHRDIKPANVLVTADGIPKLLDFGIAKLVSPEATRDATATRMMTPDYASPEQLLGELVTTATDVYSLGVLLFELLTERRPFSVETRLPSSEAPMVSSVTRSPALRGDLDNIVARALEVDPARRYASVEKLADDIRNHLTGHPVAARRPTFRYRAAKFVRRNMLAVSLGLAIVLVMALALVVTQREKRIAEQRFEQVRSLARAVVFELHDAIAVLPGSTPARELLVRRALVYLDTLAAEAEDNRALQLELAGAYIKIGDVQGRPYSPNLGDSAGALRSYGQALALARTALAADTGNDGARRLLADAYDRIGFVKERSLQWAAALRDHESARALREQIAQRGPADDLALARTWVAIGDCRYVGNLASTRESLAAYENALAIIGRIPDKDSSDALTETARAHQRIGGFLSGARMRDLPRAIRHHDAAVHALAQRARREPANAVAQRNLADQIVMKATAQNRIGDYQGAFEGTSRALVIFERLAAADPSNVEAQHDLAFGLEQAAIALVGLNRYDEAEKVVGRAVAIRHRLIAADPGNREDRRGLLTLLGTQMKITVARGDSAGTEALQREAEKVTAELKRK